MGLVLSLSQPPVSLLGEQKVPFSPFRNIPGLGLFIGGSCLFLLGFIHFLIFTVIPASVKPKVLSALRSTLMSGILAHPRVKKGVFLTALTLLGLPVWGE